METILASIVLLVIGCVHGLYIYTREEYDTWYVHFTLGILMGIAAFFLGDTTVFLEQDVMILSMYPAGAEIFWAIESFCGEKPGTIWFGRRYTNVPFGKN